MPPLASPAVHHSAVAVPPDGKENEADRSWQVSDSVKFLQKTQNGFVSVWSMCPLRTGIFDFLCEKSAGGLRSGEGTGGGMGGQKRIVQSNPWRSRMCRSCVDHLAPDEL